jgi:hypothetical protein
VGCALSVTGCLMAHLLYFDAGFKQQGSDKYEKIHRPMTFQETINYLLFFTKEDCYSFKGQTGAFLLLL